jgi:ABC-type multidrug transport system ATPase subunit
MQVKIFIKDVSNKLLNTIVLDKSKYIVGRNTTNQIVLENTRISREHFLIENKNGIWTGLDLKSTNGVFVNNLKVEDSFQIYDKLEVDLANEYKFIFEFGDHIEIKKESNYIINTSELESNKIDINHLLNSTDFISIGRADTNKVIVNSILVSRNHCEVYKNNTSWYLKDLDSTNGTFLNGKKVKGEALLSDNDIIGVGNYIIILKPTENSLSAIIVHNISKSYNKQKVLQPINIEFKRSSFSAIMGPSGCGKSTLIKILNGSVDKDQGVVLIEGIKLEAQNYDFLKKYIGYVPQDDILHSTLTLEQTIEYSSKLRLPLLKDTDRKNKVNAVLKQLGIDSIDLKNRKISQLSGGQRKRVSIAIELLNEPKILFLDEPTSPLDPQSIFDFLTCIRNLVNNGITVIMVTHKPEDLKYVDNVIFLSKGGYLVYTGVKEDLLISFNKDKIEQIYEQFDSVLEGEKHNKVNIVESNLYNSKKDVAYKPKYEWSQLKYLTLRYLMSKIGDKNNIILTFIQPFAIALLLCMAFDNVSLSLIFVVAITSIWLGANNAAVEIVNEINIFKRERQVFLNTHFYIISKVLILIIFAVIQNLILVSILYINYNDSIVEINKFINMWIVMSFVSFFATLLGLLLSSIFNTSEKVMTALPLILIPQIIFSGVIIPLSSKFKAFVSFFCISRWGTEFLARVQENVFEEQTQYVIYVFGQLNNYSSNLFHQLDSDFGNFIWIFIASIILYIGIYKCLNKN